MTAPRLLYSKEWHAMSCAVIQVDKWSTGSAFLEAPAMCVCAGVQLKAGLYDVTPSAAVNGTGAGAGGSHIIAVGQESAQPFLIDLAGSTLVFQVSRSCVCCCSGPNPSKLECGTCFVFQDVHSQRTGDGYMAGSGFSLAVANV